MRAPGTCYNDAVCDILRRLGMGLLTWSVDTEDWFTQNADAVYSAVIAGAYDGAVIICHDSHITTVNAMERVIPELTDMGYQLVTVPELMAAKGIPFEAGKIYAGF